MGPWDGTKKKEEKEEEEKWIIPQNIISKKFIYNELCISLLDTFFKNYNILLMKFDTGGPNELTYETNTKRIVELFNQSLVAVVIRPKYSNINETITISDIIPGIFRHSMIFNSTGYVIASLSMSSRFNNLFFIYKLSTETETLFSFKTAAFGLRFVPPIISIQNGSLIIGSVAISEGGLEGFIVIGENSYGGKAPASNYPNKANAGEINKWCCVSVHWYPGSKKSSIWCNGKRLINFTKRGITASSREPFPMAFGAYIKFYAFGLGRPNEYRIIDRFSGSIALCSYNRKEMTEDEIKLHHHVFCKHWYNIDHDPIIFD